MRIYSSSSIDDYNDIVFGLQVSVNDKLNIEYAEKRIMKLCSRAKKR